MAPHSSPHNQKVRTSEHKIHTCSGFKDPTHVGRGGEVTYAEERIASTVPAGLA